MQANRSLDVVRTTFQLLALGALILSSFWIVRPFLMASIWATMIAIATWPLLLHTQAWLGGRRSLAVAVMTLALLLVLLVPFYVGVTTIVENAGLIVDWSKSLTSLAVPQPPAWVDALPAIGPRLAGRWQQLAATSPEEISARIVPAYAPPPDGAARRVVTSARREKSGSRSALDGKSRRGSRSVDLGDLQCRPRRLCGSGQTGIFAKRLSFWLRR